LKPSERNYDWLGNGIYFWEADPIRAMDWAKWRKKRGDYKNPAIVGAVIDLGNCLDLTTHDDLASVKMAYDEYVKEQKLAGLEIAENKNVQEDLNEDRLLRYLDCAVINHLHNILKLRGVEAFDTVRGMFTEGDNLYENAGFRLKTHTQISVINSKCIKGYFIPR
jgi:hypothetical protein